MMILTHKQATMIKTLKKTKILLKVMKIHMKKSYKSKV